MGGITISLKTSEAAKLSQLPGENLDRIGALGSLWRPRVATSKPRGSSAVTRKCLDRGVGRGDPVPAQADDPVLSSTSVLHSWNFR